MTKYNIQQMEQGEIMVPVTHKRKIRSCFPNTIMGLLVLAFTGSAMLAANSFHFVPYNTFNIIESYDIVEKIFYVEPFWTDVTRYNVKMFNYFMIPTIKGPTSYLKDCKVHYVITSPENFVNAMGNTSFENFMDNLVINVTKALEKDLKSVQPVDYITITNVECQTNHSIQQCIEQEQNIPMNDSQEDGEIVAQENNQEIVTEGNNPEIVTEGNIPVIVPTQPNITRDSYTIFVISDDDGEDEEEGSRGPRRNITSGKRQRRWRTTTTKSLPSITLSD